MSIRLQGVTKSFGDPPTRVLKGISLDIPHGEFVSLTGRSGSGKSTLLYLMSTLDAPTSGEVLMDGRNVTQMTSPELHLFRNQRMGFVFQFHYLLPELTSLENVLMPTLKTGQGGKRRAQALAMLRQFGMDDKLNNLPRQLSGGEAQRVAIARALIMDPLYLFADEPTGNLDSANGELVMQLLVDTNRQRGTTIIMVTHDPDFAAMAARQVYLKDGTIESRD